MCPSAKKRKPFLSQLVHEGNGFSVCQCGICVCSRGAGRLLLTKAGNDHSRRSKRYGASTVFHLRAMAGGCAVAGRDVDVQAVQAVRAVVAVAAPGTLRCHEPSADSAGKAVAAGVGFVVACLVLLSFVFVLHWFLPKAFLRREAWRVWICRPPGQRTRSDVLVCFK